MHTIRLRHPWQCETVAGRAEWSRSFNWPPDNDEVTAIFLVIEPWPPEATVTLNSEPLDESVSPGRFAVTAMIRDSNRLQISLPAEHVAQEQFPLEVRLDIVEITQA